MRKLSRRGFFSILAGVGTASAATVSALTAATAAKMRPEPAPHPLSHASPHDDMARPEIFRAVGTVTAFDHDKGYGYVTPDGGGENILLHITCLRASGYQTVRAGARVDCDVLRRANGPQVFHIVKLVGSTAVGPKHAHVAVAAESDWEKASVKWFNKVRGFGFLTTGESEADIFVHIDTLLSAGLAELRPGQIIQVRWGRGAKGLVAAALRPHWM